ncbi:MAG TPA: 3,4-dehydroadipyl-CoA semialdehyde dehydrogenase [Burkholderiales bacterium]|nr:3,4-dehydroadipyl-CoA semialdehyde dehydrogenase [Burkholderiales bacterium]
MLELRSYVGGRWVAGTGAPQALLNPTTEEPLAHASSEGVDLQAALHHARSTGGPALRAMSFAERGAALKAIAEAIQTERERLLELGIANGGNTRSDAKFDVDGAIATLLAYSETGTSLGSAKFLVDGEGIQLGRSARFHGQHIAVPRHGVAVHVNAFNFPAWGFAEKAAVALLAGMPVLSKPATSSALLAHRIMELIVEKKLLPDGALSFLVGGARDLVSHLGGQDVLAFTGSGATGAQIRSAQNVIREAVRVNVEADSLNAAVLGPDVEPRSDMYELFLKDVVRDMTQKAGQKCTAIRRVLVPQEWFSSVKQDLAELLGAIRVGDPKYEDTRMGPLASREQLADVREGVARLGGRHAFGSVAPVGSKGFFIAPILIEDAGEAVHEREVFGPVASLVRYKENPAEIVARGNGGLVSSVYSDDQEFIERMVTELAPYHGRLFLGHPKIELSPGPGTVLPQLVHGGPGRAGGGEELGGPRGLAFYLQRVGLEGSRPVIAKLIGSKSA